MRPWRLFRRCYGIHISVPYKQSQVSLQVDCVRRNEIHGLLLKCQCSVCCLSLAFVGSILVLHFFGGVGGFCCLKPYISKLWAWFGMPANVILVC